MRARSLVMVIALAFALVGCGGDDEEQSAERTVTVTTTTAETGTTTAGGRSRYPDVIVENYMRSCTRGDRRKQAYCECTLDELSAEVSVADFARIGAQGGKLSPRMRRLITQAAAACADKL